MIIHVLEDVQLNNTKRKLCGVKCKTSTSGKSILVPNQTSEHNLVSLMSNLYCYLINGLDVSYNNGEFIVKNKKMYKLKIQKDVSLSYFSDNTTNDCAYLEGLFKSNCIKYKLNNNIFTLLSNTYTLKYETLHEVIKLIKYGCSDEITLDLYDGVTYEVLSNRKER